MYVLHENEAPSRNHLYRGKETSITHYECVTLALAMQHEKRMRRIILSCDLFGFTLFSLIVSQMAGFSAKRY
jgi:hypothetical protein